MSSDQDAALRQELQTRAAAFSQKYLDQPTKEAAVGLERLGFDVTAQKLIETMQQVPDYVAEVGEVDPRTTVYLEKLRGELQNIAQGSGEHVQRGQPELATVTLTRVDALLDRLRRDNVDAEIVLPAVQRFGS